MQLCFAVFLLIFLEALWSVQVVWAEMRLSSESSGLLCGVLLFKPFMPSVLHVTQPSVLLSVGRQAQTSKRIFVGVVFVA